MIILTIVILMAGLNTAAAHLECSYKFPVWQVCRVHGGSSKEPHAPVSSVPSDPGTDSPGNSGGKGKGKGKDK